MAIIVRGKSFEVTEAIKEYVEEKVSRLFNYTNNLEDVEVILGGDSKKGFNIEIIALLAGEKLVGKESSKDLYEGIDKCKKIVKGQITKHKQSFHKA